MVTNADEDFKRLDWPKALHWQLAGNTFVVFFLLLLTEQLQTLMVGHMIMNW